MGPRGTGEVRRGEAPATPAPGPNPEGRGRKSPPRTGLSACATKRRKVRGTTSPGPCVQPTRPGRPASPSRPHARPGVRTRPTPSARRAPPSPLPRRRELRLTTTRVREPPGRRSPNRSRRRVPPMVARRGPGPAGAEAPRRVRVLAGAGGAAAEVAADEGARVPAPVPARRPATATRPRMGATRRRLRPRPTATPHRPEARAPRGSARPVPRTSSRRWISTRSPARSSARPLVHDPRARAGVRAAVAAEAGAARVRGPRPRATP